MSEGNEISAEYVVEAIFKENKPEYVLDGKTIKGKLDMRHRVISVAIKITNCTFEDEVDLSHAEFKQCVDFSRSTFKKGFCCRNAIYNKDIKCEETVFKNEVEFALVQCQGNGYFAGTVFENPDRTINFSDAKFNYLAFSAIEFIYINDTKFADDLNKDKISEDLRIALKYGNISLSNSVEVAIEIENTVWIITDKDSNQIYTVIYNVDSFLVLKHRGAIFNGGANFNSIQCEDSGIFINAKFENKEKDIDFGRAEFGGDLTCIGAIFRGGVNFNTIQCEGGFLQDAHFENPEKDIDFGRARFGIDLACTRAIFKGGASFNSMQCEVAGFFSDAHFGNAGKDIDFSYTKFGGNLELNNATFAGNISFFHAQVAGSLVLINTTFQKNVDLYCANLHTFRLEDSRQDENSRTFSGTSKGKLDLRRFIFTTFDGSEREQKHVLERQSQVGFSIDPYLQFEKYYNSIGNDSNAKKVYYKGRSELRKNARRRFAIRKSERKKRNPDIRWSLGKLILDYLNCLFVGYGAKLELSFLYLVILLFAGAFLWSDEAMIPKSAIANNSDFFMTVDSKQRDNILNELNVGKFPDKLHEKLPISSDSAYITIVKKGSEWDINSDSSKEFTYKAKVEGNDINIYKITNFKPKSFLYKLGYSLDMLVPIADLKIADEYKFPSDWYGFYIVMHTILGWILIPLLISSLAGVLRKKG